jgi:hypothetical protein
MLSIPKTVKCAALLGLGTAATANAPASAYIVRTSCLGDECYRERCSNDGYDCVRISYRDFDRYRYEPTRYTCNPSGLNCHYVPRGYHDEDSNWHSYEY